MHNNNYFVCNRCGIGSIEHPDCEYGMCGKCSRDSYLGTVKSILDTFPLDIGNKIYLHALNLQIEDYREPIETDGYTLVKADANIKQSLERLLDLCKLDIRLEVIENTKYLLATDIALDFERVECHLHNKFSESCEFSRSVIMSYKTHYCDWSFRHKIQNNILTVSTEGIEEISGFVHDKAITLNDVDVQFILSRLEKAKDGHLFRGTNRFYFQNDGIAASIYRNNRDLADRGKLQDHENEIVSNLLNKKFYQPELKRPISALTDLRHFGQDTCLLDFSEDFKIALFFSCHPMLDKSHTIAEVLILDKSQYELHRDLEYPNTEDFLVSPAITDVTRNRVEAQKSIFLYCHQGYLPRNECRAKISNLLITPSLKSAFFGFSEYSEELIYPDFHAFIANPQNFMTKAKLEYQQNDNEVDPKYT